MTKRAVIDQLNNRAVMKGFGEHLQWLREVYDARWPGEHTKAKWAARLKISRAMYGRWEAGTSLPKLIDLITISYLFRVDLNYLLAGVLADRMESWLHTALQDAHPELQREEMFWGRQAEIFERAGSELRSQTGSRSNRAARRIPLRND